MNRVLQACVISLSVFVTQAFAQDMGDAPPQTETQTENVNMQMGPPGMPAMNMNMNVQVQHTRTTTTTTTTTVPAAAQAPAPQPAGRDCGTGQDPGCTMTRHGQLPMDADEFNGFLQSLRGNDNELDRQEMVKSTVSSSHLTAKQLALVLDLFDNEITRFDVAKVSAPKVVNPKHALGLSTKFSNSIYATDFSKLMNAQH